MEGQVVLRGLPGRWGWTEVTNRFNSRLSVTLREGGVCLVLL